jgi:EAL and modified HD-GYP domain-containing signal transduction protein
VSTERSCAATEKDSTTRADSVEVVVGRQPIFDSRRRVFGYELLFRQLCLTEPETGTRPVVNDLLMTPEVLFNSLSIGIDRLVGDKQMFINGDRALLTGSLPLLLPPDRVVIEILETVRPEPEVIVGCKRLAARRFTLALDDFVWFDGAERLLELASIVKIDVLALDHDALRETLRHCREFEVRLLAEKVETAAQLRECTALGFDYFQGYLLARPDTVSGRSLDPASFARLQLVAQLLDEERDADELEAVIGREPALAHQVIRLAGLGAAHGLRREVSTLREALVLAGTRRLRSWASLVLMVSRGEVESERAMTALVRARMCELLAEPLGPLAAQQAFTVGMVASFDLLLGIALEKIVDALPLARELREAVLRKEGPLGGILAAVIDFQLGPVDRAPGHGAESLRLSRCWSEALRWAFDVSELAA